MIVSVEVPDKLAEQFHLSEAASSRALLEAFLLQRYAEGQLTSGQVGDALGLSFQETERFLFDHGAPANVTPEEQLRDLANLDRFRTR